MTRKRAIIRVGLIGANIAVVLFILWLSRPPEGVDRYIMRVEGQRRLYLVYHPTEEADALPLVVDMHGWGGRAESQYAGSGFATIAEQEGALIVYPQAKGNRRLWNPDADLTFFNAMLDEVLTNYPVDASRIYVTGHSAGAFAAQYMGAAASERVAAVGSVSGALPAANMTGLSEDIGTAHYLVGFEAPPPPTHPVPIMFIHGTQDANVPYEAVDLAVAQWAAWNGCPEAPAQCEPPIVVQPFEGGHWYPAESPRELWAFFTRFSR